MSVAGKFEIDLNLPKLASIEKCKIQDARQLVAGLIFRLDPLRQSSRDLGGVDARRAIRGRDRRTTARRVLSVSQWVHFSLPPKRCHKVTRSLGSAGFTRAGVRTFDRSVGRGYHQREILCRSRYTHTYVHIRITIEIHSSIFRPGIYENRSITHEHSKTAVVINIVSVR